MRGGHPWLPRPSRGDGQEFKAATVRGGSTTVPCVWTLVIPGAGGGESELTFYDNFVAVNKATNKFGAGAGSPLMHHRPPVTDPPGGKSGEDALYTFYRWSLKDSASAYELSILSDGKIIHSFLMQKNVLTRSAMPQFFDSVSSGRLIGPGYRAIHPTN